MTVLARKAGMGTILDWIPSLGLHLYWIATTSNGNGPLVRQKWLSFLRHCVDIHEGHGALYPKCMHEALAPRKWMIEGMFAEQDASRLYEN
jgi:hypothetical protein